MIKPANETADRYRIFYGTTIDNLNQSVNKSSTLDTVTHELTGLAGNTNYFIQVQAGNRGGFGELSEIIQVKTLPSIPTAPRYISLRALTDQTMLFEFDDRSNNEDGFIIDRLINGQSNYVLLDTLPPNSTQYVDHNLQGNTRYTYRVSAYNQGGESSKVSTPFFFTRAEEFKVKDLEIFSDFENVYVPIEITRATVLDTVAAINQKIAIKNDEAEVAEIIPQADFFPVDVKVEFTHENDTLEYFIRVESDTRIARLNRLDTLVTLRLRKAVTFNEGEINIDAQDMTFSFRDFSVNASVGSGKITVNQRDASVFKSFIVKYYDPVNDTYVDLPN